MDSVSQEFHTRPVVDASTCETASRSEIDPPRVAFAARPMGGPVTADDFREIASAVRAVPAKERPAHKAAVRRAANAKRPYLERSDRAVLDRVLDEWLIWSQGHTRGDLTLDKMTADMAGIESVPRRTVIRALQRLCGHGILAAMQTRGPYGRQGPTLYTVPALASVSERRSQPDEPVSFQSAISHLPECHLEDSRVPSGGTHRETLEGTLAVKKDSPSLPQRERADARGAGKVSLRDEGRVADRIDPCHVAMITARRADTEQIAYWLIGCGIPEAQAIGVAAAAIVEGLDRDAIRNAVAGFRDATAVRDAVAYIWHLATVGTDAEGVKRPLVRLGALRAELAASIKARPVSKVKTNGAKGMAAAAPFWWRGKEKTARTLGVDRWRRAVENFATDQWCEDQLGPRPGTPECIVPPELVAELDLVAKFGPDAPVSYALEPVPTATAPTSTATQSRGTGYVGHQVSPYAPKNIEPGAALTPRPPPVDRRYIVHNLAREDASGLPRQWWPNDVWLAQVREHANSSWPHRVLGMWPGHPKAEVPDDVVAELGIGGAYDSVGLLKKGREGPKPAPAKTSEATS